MSFEYYDIVSPSVHHTSNGTKVIRSKRMTNERTNQTATTKAYTKNRTPEKYAVDNDRVETGKWRTQNEVPSSNQEIICNKFKKNWRFIRTKKKTRTNRTTNKKIVMERMFFFS